VSFQPLASFGRIDIKKGNEPVTLSGIVRRIIEQAPETFEKGDIIPLPCNVDRVAVSYLVRGADGELRPITRSVRVLDYLPFIDNTFVFDASRMMGSCSCMGFLKNLIPKDFTKKDADGKIGFVNDDTFRVTVNSFVDPDNFDLKSMQKECVHLITPDLRRIPLSAYNMVHRKQESNHAT